MTVSVTATLLVFVRAHLRLAAGINNVALSLPLLPLSAAAAADLAGML